jgi:peptidoglycan/LPS O-acetylase OafA/YrhL
VPQATVLPSPTLPTDAPPQSPPQSPPSRRPGAAERRAPRLAALDGLRLVAALSVAVYHYTVSWRIDGVRPPEYFLPTASHVTIYGFLGVELFFLISGFVICMSSWGRRLGDFFRSRVSRLYPAYWACVLITAATVTLVPITGGLPVSGQPRLIDIAVNLTMVQEPIGVPSVDTVYWTLFVELRFYLLFAIVVGPGLTYRRAVYFCAVWMIVAVIGPSLGSPWINAIAITTYAPYFIAGIAMYLIHRFGATPLLAGIVGFCWLVSLQRVDLRMSDIHPGFPVPSWPGAAVVTAAYAVMLAVALGWTDRIRWRWLSLAGAITYPLYLLHQRIGYVTMRTAYENTTAPVWSLVAGTLAAVIVLAWLVYRLVEVPLGPRIRAALQRRPADVRVVAVDRARQPATGPAAGDPGT